MQGTYSVKDEGRSLPSESETVSDMSSVEDEVDETLYYRRLIKALVLTTEPVGPMDICSLASGQLRYQQVGEGEGEWQKRTVIISSWWVHDNLRKSLSKLLTKNFPIYVDRGREFEAVTIENVATIALKSSIPVTPQDTYERAARLLGKAQEEIYRITWIEAGYKLQDYCDRVILKSYRCHEQGVTIAQAISSVPAGSIDEVHCVYEDIPQVPRELPFALSGPYLPIASFPLEELRRCLACAFSYTSPKELAFFLLQAKRMVKLKLDKGYIDYLPLPQNSLPQLTILLISWKTVISPFALATILKAAPNLSLLKSNVKNRMFFPRRFDRQELIERVAENKWFGCRSSLWVQKQQLQDTPPVLSLSETPHQLSYTPYFFKYDPESPGSTQGQVNPRDYRLQVYHQVELAPDAIRYQPIRFTDEMVSPMGEFLPEEMTKNLGVYPVYVDHTWQPLPSLSAHEQLTFLEAYRFDGGRIESEIEVGHCESTAQFMVRLRHPESPRQQVNLRFGLARPEAPSADFPPLLAALIETYTSFKQAHIDFSGASSGAEILAAIKSQKTGACRFRVVAFLKDFQALDLDGWHASIVTGPVHHRIELKQAGQVYTVDLGGVPVEVVAEGNIAAVSMPDSAATPIDHFPSLTTLVRENRCLYLKHTDVVTLNQLMLLWQQEAKSDAGICFIHDPWGVPSTTSEASVLVINLQQWRARDLIRLHPLLDRSLADGAPVLLFLDTIRPLDQSFVSRLGHQVMLTFDQASAVSQRAKAMLGELASPVVSACFTKGADPGIDLFESSDWPILLFGQPSLVSGRIIFEKEASPLCRQMQSMGSDGRIVIRNPPQDPRFWRWLQECRLNDEMVFPGLEPTPWPKGICLGFEEDMSEGDAETLLFRQGVSEAKGEEVITLVLNPYTFSYFFGGMQENSEHYLAYEMGWLERAKGQSMHLKITRNLQSQAYRRLFSKAKEYGISLTIEDCHFPMNEVTATVSADDAVIRIPLAALTRQDLTGSWQKTETGDYVFEPSELMVQLQREERPIVFYGNPVTLPCALLDVISIAVLQQQWLCNGRIYSLNAPVSFVSSSECKVEPLAESATPLVLRGAVYDHERCEALSRVLSRYPYVLIEGDTGVGKTHFVMQTLLPQVAEGHLGIEKMMAWAQSSKEGIKLLVLDEANIDTSLDFLAGLAQKPRVLYWRGQVIELSEDHRVVLMGNPKEYGGERQVIPWLESPENRVIFTPYPPLVLQQGVILPLLQSLSVLVACRQELLAYLMELPTRGMVTKAKLTPREYQMILLMMQALHLKTEAPYLECLRYAAYLLLQQFINVRLPAEIHSLFSRCALPESRHAGFVFVEEHRSILEVLDLFRRIYLYRNTPSALHFAKTGLGLSHLVIEGSAGVGKTELIRAYLKYCEIDFMDIHPCYSLGEKERLLREGFAAGKIILIDEDNGSVPLERVRNELLDSIPKPGVERKYFGAIISTQNSIAAAGRSLESPAMRHRQWKVLFAPVYSLESLRKMFRLAPDFPLKEGMTPRELKQQLAAGHRPTSATNWLRLSHARVVREVESKPTLEY